MQALDEGADDYLTKPFGTDELFARIRAALRRSGPGSEGESFSAGPLRIDLKNELVYLDGEELR